MENNSFVDTIDNHLFINEENITVEKELHTELIFKNDTIDDKDKIEVDGIKNEKPEEGCNDSDSVISEKHEPVHENDKHLHTINYENIKLEKELHTELIIKSEGLHGTVLGEKLFTCEICNKSFTRQRDLIRHKQIHSVGKQFSCDICNKTFTKQSDLIRHNQIHSGEKKFSCDICDKRFNRQSNLVRHKRIHSGDKPFSCDVCNKSFSDSSNLVHHKRIHSW